VLEILGFWCAGGSRKPLIAFSAMGVDSRSSIFGVDSTAAAVAGPVDINAMLGGDDDDTAAAGAAALAAARAAASARHRCGSRSGLSRMLRCLLAVDWNETMDMRIGA
jgi:hypothetical protein